MVSVLEQIAQRGAHVKIAPGAVDPAILSQELQALRVAGHAIVAEETFDHRKVSLGITVTHYLNCRRCSS